jgi:Lrp/AsnC family transcriptional regulator, regulator for asnA, asnC and gidA
MSMPAPDPGRPRPIQRPDELDLRLLTFLQQDPRASLRQLARQAGVAPGTVAERLERLRSQGVIRGVILDIDPAALGFSLEVLLGVSASAEASLHDLIRKLLDLPWVREVHAVTGRWDLVVTLCVRDQAHLLDVVQDEIRAIEGLTRTESLVVLRSHLKPGGVLDQIAGDG